MKIVHLDYKCPPSSCVPTVPKKIKQKPNSTSTSTRTGIDFMIVFTSEGIWGIYFMAFKGLSVLTTLMPLIDPLARPRLSHPRKTTLKSRIFHPSLK